MPRIITEAEARANIAQLINDAANGEEFIISRGNGPSVRLMPGASEMEINEEKYQQRVEAIAAIERWHRRVIGPPMTIEEIISARDEGRK